MLVLQLATLAHRMTILTLGTTVHKQRWLSFSWVPQTTILALTAILT